MGRSTPSCFKIISCAGSNEAAVDPDHIHVSSENKSPDKRGWSFRKRSGRHRVLSNTVVTEKITSSDNKPISEPISISSEPQINSNISEKTCDSIWTEEIPTSVTKNATVSTVDHTKSACEEDDIKCESVPDRSESAVLVIQAAVRRFLAERQLVKHKNVVKLQAAMRGHLVRNHAVGTLRCVQAIVKMQALVRARRQKGVQNAGIDLGPKYISIEKLLSNRLACQLLESTPKTKQINIKCDPLKSDSAWNWLERWMSVSSPDVLESHAREHDQDKVVINSKNAVETVATADVEELMVPSEEKENLIHIEESFIVKAHEDEKPVTESIEKPDSLPNEPMDLNTEPQIEVNPIPQNPVSETELKPIPENPVSVTKPEPIPENPVSETKPEPELIPENPVSETKPETELIPENPVSETKPEPIPENPVSETKPKLIPENPVSEMEPKRAAKRVATDQPDSEGRKSVFGSRKASNPAFIAAQSRFEELTSMTKPLKPANSSNQDDVSGCSSSPADISSSARENVTLVRDVDPDEHLVSHGSIAVRIGGSECGTELSVTSTLDSPDQFEVKIEKPEEPKIVNEAAGNDINSNIEIVMPEKQVDQKLNDTEIELEPEQEPESSQPEHEHKSNEHELAPQISASGSPRSHITIPESQGTPSSQVSTNTKKSKSDKKSTSQKRKSWSTSKKSSVDSGPRASLEQLPKDTKPGKRRNSFGSPKPDHVDHEVSVPSYMQATESARAKAIANSSPALSPDVHDKETYLKKRHSLPGAVNGRQGSPRIQRSMSQALQATKGNGNQERKWQR
ncbi:putative IQ motif, EF-hand binding protein [Helianthus annuus]|nr:putative IQ motif, EF-hand binding protein [Helianthus annuus]